MGFNSAFKGLKHTYEQAEQSHILTVTIQQDFAILGCYVA